MSPQPTTVGGSGPGDGEEPKSPLVVLFHLYRDVARSFFCHVGMSRWRLEVLHELMHAGETSQKDLQQRPGIEGALLTRFLKQMEATDLVTRRPDPKDNRLTLVTLAPAGRRAIRELSTRGQEFEMRALAGLCEDERAEMTELLRRIQDNLARWQPGQGD